MTAMTSFSFTDMFRNVLSDELAMPVKGHVSFPYTIGVGSTCMEIIDYRKS